MKSVKFTKENLESLKTTHFNNLNKNILSYVLDLLSEINFQNLDKFNSVIEFRNENDIESICFTLSSMNCIPIEIVLHKNYIDMSVAGLQAIREMNEIRLNKINEDLSFLQEWLNCNLINEIKYSGNFIINSIFYCKSEETRKIIFKTSSLFGFLSFGKYRKLEYKSWKG
jgi:hypothetical protein